MLTVAAGYINDIDGIAGPALGASGDACQHFCRKLARKAMQVFAQVL